MRQPRGMTLVEAVVSLAILAVILVIASQLTMSMNMISAEETAENQIQTDLRRAMSELVFLIEESRPVAMWREDQIATQLPHLPKAPDNTYNYNGNEDTKDRGLSFTYTLPLKDITGRLRTKGTTAADKTDHGQVLYGSGDMGSGQEFYTALASNSAVIDPASLKNTYTIFFRPTGEVLDEAVEGVDIDGNGLANERFIFGTLNHSDDATGVIRTITGRIAIKRFIGLATLYTAAQEMERSRDGRGKIFYLECEDVQEDTSAERNGIYDNLNADTFTDGNQNSRWDVKMIIRFYCPMVDNDPRRGKVIRLRAVETRVNYFRNTYKQSESKKHGG